MKDWNGIVTASGFQIPAEDVGRIVKPLDSLEAAFRPLADSLTFADEPAAIFDAEDGE
jgi:hypothetical protein